MRLGHGTGLAVLAIVAVTMTAACSDSKGSVSELSGATPVDRGAVLDGLVDTVMVPAYEHLAAAATQLATATTELCAAPDAAGLTATRAAWDEARTAWRATEAFRFGPAETGRAMSAIAYPADAAKIDRLLAAADPPTPFTAESLGGRGADVRGLGGMEQVLFAPTAPGDLDARRCSYLTSAAALISTAATATAAAWTQPTGEQAPFADQVRNPGEGSAYADDQGVIEDLVNGTISALTAVADMRLGRASGDITGTPEPATVDAGAAHRTLDDVATMLASVQAVVAGNPSGTADPASPSQGLGGLVGELSGPTRTNLVRQLEDSVTAVAAIPPPLADLTDDHFPAVQAAYEQVRAARVTLRTQVASILGITLSFSDSDGDS